MGTNALPNLYNTPLEAIYATQVKYPFTRSWVYSTVVHKFGNGSEQRMPNSVPLATLSLPFSNLGIKDITNWVSFFNLVKGQFSNNIAVFFNPTPSNLVGGPYIYNLSLDSDDLNVIARSPGAFDQTVTLKQVLNSGWAQPPTPSQYPSFKFATGAPIASAEYPFQQTTRFATQQNISEFGPQYSYALYNAGLTNFPTGPLHSWKLTYPLLTDEDALTLENFFLGVMGRCYSFTFTDPITMLTYTNVRMDQDTLSLQSLTVNQVSTAVTLVETFGS